MTHRSKILDQVFAAHQELRELPTNVFTVIAENIHDTLSLKTSDEMKVFTEQLGDLLHDAIQKVPQDVMSAIRGSHESNQAYQDAYILGKLSFAHALLANATAKRVSSRFYTIIEGAEYEKYIRALLSSPLSTEQLKQIVGEDEVTVKIIMKELRGEGVTDFRREEGVTVNFLTPAAETIASALHIEPEK